MIDQEIKQAILLKRRTGEDCIYAAGFFDGEGSVGIYRRHSRSTRHPEKWQFHCVAVVTNTDRPIVEWLKERWGGTITTREQFINPSLFIGKATTLFSSPTFMWHLSHRLAGAFYEDILPYAKVKRPLIKNALEFQRAMGPIGGYLKGLPDEVYAKQLWHWERHKEIAARLKKARGRMPKAS